MKLRLLSFLGAVCALSLGALAADKAAPAPALTTIITAKKSAITVGSGSIALVKGTKLEVIAREGDLLLVKFHAAQGKVPLADTDFNPDTPLPEVETAAPTPAVEKAAPAQSAPAAAPAAKTPPPALAVDGKPASNYGKMVQKAKQAEQAHNDKLVKPSDDILDEKAKK